MRVAAFFRIAATVYQVFGAILTVVRRRDIAITHARLLLRVERPFGQNLVGNFERTLVAFDMTEIAIVDRHRRGKSEEHTSELQSLMRISYAVFCLKKKKNSNTTTTKHE